MVINSLILDQFKVNCCKLLTSKSINIAYMITSTLLCLMYDFEKAKYDFKQYGYDCLVSLKENIDLFNNEIITQEDNIHSSKAYLEQTRYNLEKLFNILG